MIQPLQISGRLAISMLLCLVLLPGAGSQPAAASIEAPGAAASDSDTSDLIATVGDQPITYNQLSTMLNSSAMVGLSVPALGTARRNRALVTLLDKAISANLIYLDALKQGMDKDPGYQRDVQRFSDALLAARYRKQLLGGGIEISEAEVMDFYKNSVVPGTELTEAAHTSIEAALRRKKLQERNAGLRDQVREGVEVSFDEAILDPADDELRIDSEEIASAGPDRIHWEDARASLLMVTARAQASGADVAMARRKALNQVIDNRIMARKARAAGLDKNPVDRARLAEFRKTHLVNLYRSKLIHDMEPSDAELQAYFENNRARLVAPESRKVQMVVVKTRKEAGDIKQRIESGELTSYQAAQQYSIDPNAKKTLGDIGWVKKGSGFPALDQVTFSLGPDEIGGPVESPAGWHLVRVVDIRDAQFTDIRDETTRKAVRRTLLHDKLDQYATRLREQDFKVVVNDKRLDQLFKQEADWIASLKKKATEPESTTQQRVQQYKQSMQP